MATLSSRKNSTPTEISEQRSTPLQILLELGFSKHRAEKALAATGYRGVQLATDWLSAHVRDPTLDSIKDREYVLYACPTGALEEQLLTFWEESQSLGWNGALNFMPHITLVSFFKAPDESTEKLVNALENCFSQNNCPKFLHLEPYVSINYMGLFVKEEHAPWLKNIAISYVEELTKLNITAVPQVRSSHLTLAYEFPVSMFSSLRSMVEKLTLTNYTKWELKLYSRDSRLKNARVHKVVHKHVPMEHNELELRIGDYIHIEEDTCNFSTDGWVEGISWLTGVKVQLPLNHTKRTAESDSWTLHATFRITDDKCGDFEEDNLHALVPKTRKPPVLSSMESNDTVDGIPIDDEPMEGKIGTVVSSRQIFICRHGERVDFTFGAWIPYCFESNGGYVRRDLNMPKTIPQRNIQDFQNDSPLTTMGEIQASLVGEAMKSSSIKIDVAFTSPSLRCIQTLDNILKGSGKTIPMKIEPGLIEWLAWYPNGVPVWMTVDELTRAGFNVDDNYIPIIKIQELPLEETAAQYYERSYELIKRIIENTVGNILIVAHAASLAACTRQLTGGKVPSTTEVTKLVQRVPYLACLTAREDSNGWQIHPPPFPPITHTSNSRFDWKVLASTEVPFFIINELAILFSNLTTD